MNYRAFYMYFITNRDEIPGIWQNINFQAFL